MTTEPHDRTIAKRTAQGKTGSVPVPAATVILLRDGDDGVEVLMLRRNSKIAFGGMWVFPGGKVDPEDSTDHDPGDDQAIARTAAVREAGEEAGVALRTDDLLPFSHWTPPAVTPRRFITWFFVAASPSSHIVIDDGEIHEHQWMPATVALERRDAMEIELAPPTWVSLHELSAWASVDEALGAVRAREPERFETRIALENDQLIALWHGDAGWVSGDSTVPGDRHRLHMRGDGWRYERSGRTGR